MNSYFPAFFVEPQPAGPARLGQYHYSGKIKKFNFSGNKQGPRVGKAVQGRVDAHERKGYTGIKKLVVFVCMGRVIQAKLQALG
jgi:hypothetical protein